MRGCPGRARECWSLARAAHIEHHLLLRVVAEHRRPLLGGQVDAAVGQVERLATRQIGHELRGACRAHTGRNDQRDGLRAKGRKGQGDDVRAKGSEGSRGRREGQRVPTIKGTARGPKGPKARGAASRAVSSIPSNLHREPCIGARLPVRSGLLWVGVVPDPAHLLELHSQPRERCGDGAGGWLTQREGGSGGFLQRWKPQRDATGKQGAAPDLSAADAAIRCSRVTSGPPLRPY